MPYEDLNSSQTTIGIAIYKNGVELKRTFVLQNYAAGTYRDPVLNLSLEHDFIATDYIEIYVWQDGLLSNLVGGAGAYLSILSNKDLF
jgi:hypothetical protein